jgi:hypothetical protein
MPSSSTDAAKRGSGWLNLLVGAMVTAALFALIEGGASVLMSVRTAKHDLRMQEEKHVRYDAELGWSNVPGLRIEGMYEGKGTFTTNSQGFRATATFDKAVPPGKFRVIALGDSFTMGFGVGDESTYAAQMQSLCPALQTVNMGQGGYGLDQSYLWYKRDGTRLESDMLLFAVIAHDFYRMESDNFIGYGKPVLRVRNNALVVENVPPPKWNTRTSVRRVRAFFESLALVRLGRWLVGGVPAPADRFYAAASERVLAAAELAYDDLAQLTRARGQRLVLAYLPTNDLLAREPTREAAWLEDYARRKGLAFVNVAADFIKLTPAEIARMYRWDYHYTEEGNRLVARSMLRQLGAKVGDFPACAEAPAR